MASRKEIILTPVEKTALATSPFDIIYSPTEKIPAIVVDNFPALGRLAAMRFIEWVQNNPGGVISLPTGKTPEHFIKWVSRMIQTWETASTRNMLESAGVNPAKKPDMKSLHFVQIDEFYPIYPSQHNSFFHYVNNFYVNGFGLDQNKAHLMDCSSIAIPDGHTLSTIWPEMKVDLSLRVRQPADDQEILQKKVLSGIDQWCQEYEDTIRSLGGIGFFLGGIGPDGHIGFNVRGSDHHSTTRLTATNYETQAAAATDLGGIEISRNRLVITIGLGTITYNRNCTALVIAAGASKAGVVADAMQQKQNIQSPGTVLHSLPNARFFLTMGAAQFLEARQAQVMAKPETVISDEQVNQIIINCALKNKKRIIDLTDSDISADPYGKLMLAKRREDIGKLTAMVRSSLIAKIEAGAQSRTNCHFLHTEPHHDDIMLGYLPAVVRHVRSATNVHFFATLTSGFTAVTNQYMASVLVTLRPYLDTNEFKQLRDEGYFSPADIRSKNRDLWRYLDGVAAEDHLICADGASRRLLRCLIEVFDETDLRNLKDRIDELLHYFKSEYPGKKDLPHIQRLKGMCREWEAECLWGYFGWNCESVMHLRLGFYTGDIFTEEPTVNRDIPPILDALKKSAPDVVSVALDPESSGPDTHYKALQAMTESLKMYSEGRDVSKLRIWGYRNVWFRFHPAEANVFVPVSLNMFSVMKSAFFNTFVSQKDASFPSHELDGPFCYLAQKIQIEQYQAMTTCLGREWFYDHPSPLIRATRGLVYLKEMTLDELLKHSYALKHATENA